MWLFGGRAWLGVKAEKARFEMRYIDQIKHEQIETYKTISTI